MTQISVEQVSKRYPTNGGSSELSALSQTSLQVGSGETVAVVGPSGCGKTTLLNLIAGFLQPTEGVIRIRDRIVTEPGPDRAMVFQADAVFPWLTVEQNLSYGPRVRGVPKNQWTERVQYYLEAVGLNDFAKSYPKALSGGMRKRVDLARAYVNNPEILLMDEPFGALDEFTKQAMEVDLVQMAAQERKTIVFITHDIEEAIFVGERVVVMSPRPGRVIDIVQVPFPQPRALALRTTPEFQSIRRDISSRLGMQI